MHVGDAAIKNIGSHVDDAIDRFKIHIMGKKINSMEIYPELSRFASIIEHTMRIFRNSDNKQMNIKEAFEELEHETNNFV